ncbi:MAG: dockerin type I repeat-containing protein, partial [Oscillospiraceae bacterium]|nr:dockerin type I repeat-containing protein [Oscillospiraceae bacterium]
QKPAYALHERLGGSEMCIRDRLDGTSASSTKVRLQTLISECEGYKKENYTDTTWNSFNVALTTAKTIYSYANADADMLRNAYDGLAKAQKELIGGVDTSTKKVLTDLVASSKNFKEENYSVASWAKFAAAVAELQDTAADKDASVTRANAAIKAYQEAIAGLSTTSLIVPSIIPKSDFDAIYGENKILARTGTTREGYKYNWEFNGKDLTAPKDFNPEVKYQSANEEKIRLEVGSASDYQLFSFAETGSFPGMAKLTLDVSAKYQNGTYRLYKWNNNKSELLNDVTIVNGMVEIKLAEGGDYFISSVLQNFELISNNFDIDHSKLTIAGAFKKKFTVNEFRNSIQNGEAVAVMNADGTLADGGKYISTGMTARAANSDVSYTIVVPGDLDGDGNITSLDAVYILRAITGDLALDSYPQKLAGDVDNDGYVTALDAVRILRYNIGIGDE